MQNNTPIKADTSLSNTAEASKEIIKEVLIGLAFAVGAHRDKRFLEDMPTLINLLHLSYQANFVKDAATAFFKGKVGGIVSKKDLTYRKICQMLDNYRSILADQNQGFEYYEIPYDAEKDNEILMETIKEIALLKQQQKDGLLVYEELNKYTIIKLSAMFDYLKGKNALQNARIPRTLHQQITSEEYAKVYAKVVQDRRMSPTLRLSILAKYEGSPQIVDEYIENNSRFFIKARFMLYILDKYEFTNN